MTGSASCLPRLPDSKIRGWEAKRFSFNRPGGRCEACARATGQKCIEMHFMPDVWVECEDLPRKALQPRNTGGEASRATAIADVPRHCAYQSDARELFANVPKV